jgi:DMSO/TMAO reductase YedYZ heme-binding membrane subunit
MLNSMSDCGVTNWLTMALMAGVGLLVFLVLMLAIAALAKHLFWRGRGNWPETP